MKFCTVIGVAGCILAVSAFAGEKRIKKSQLPTPVQKAMEQASQGAQVVGYARETEHGQTFYELELNVNGRTRDVTFDSQGNTLAVEQEVAIDALPAAAQEGLRRAAGKGRITLVETITKNGLVTYEGHVRGGPHEEVTVDAGGKPVTQ